MSELKILIKNVEELWLSKLYDNCQMQFKKVKIPSHDSLHHLRVWLIAKELFQELEKNDIEISRNDLEKAIIGIFFHDIGMVQTTDKQHGIISKEMCESFFKVNKLERIEGFDEILGSIEKHDDKEYKSMVYHGKLQKSVLSIVCVSDDLDAFGAIGVFRYLEIYLLRNVPIIELAGKILENLKNRYENFHNLYSQLDRFTEKQKERFEFISGFYQDLSREINEGGYSKGIDIGAIGVVNLLIKNIVVGKDSITTISEKILKSSKDEYVLEFFKLFQKEIENAHP